MTAEKLKIAVQLYGHLRTFETCAPLLRRHLLDHYDCDVFIHTWDRTEHATRSWYADSLRAEPDVVDTTILAKVSQLYAPKSIKVEAQDFLDEPGHFGTHPKIQISLQGLKYMTYGQYQANLLRETYQQENGLRYDYVVVTRPDIMPLVDLDLTAFQHEFAFNSRCSIHLVHKSEIRIRGQKFIKHPDKADVLYFATPDTISDICRLYLAFEHYYKDIKTIMPAGVSMSETSFFEYIYSKGIIPREYQFYFAIKRKEDENDIKLSPSSTYLLGDSPRLIKAAIRFYVDCCPAPLIKVTKRVLASCTSVLDYIQTYENMK